MKKLKHLLAIILCLNFTAHLIGQKIKYNDVKNEFSTQDYKTKITNPKFSPFGAGVLNYLLPSTGYFYVGETSRGIVVLVTEGVIAAVLVRNIKNDLDNFTINFQKKFLGINQNKSSNSQNIVPTKIIVPIFLGIYVWSIFDVAKVAKVKNLAYQKRDASLSIEPNIILLDQGSGNTIHYYGLKLNYNF